MSSATEDESDIDESWPHFDSQADAPMRRFNGEGVIEDLEEAIEMFLSLGYPHRSILLHGLIADAAFNRFEQLGAIADLHEAIDGYRNALSICPPGHPDRSLSLATLANAVKTRFDHLGVIADLHEAIDLHQDALALRPSGHPLRSSSLNNLAAAVLTRFEQLGAIADLHEAIYLLQNALALRPPGHPDHSMSLSNLASAIERRFEQLGAIADLHEAIGLYRDALAFHPPGHPDHSFSLSNLANAVLIRFDQLGAIADLHESIDLHRNALAIRPSGHPHHSFSLNNLAGAVERRFEQLGTIADLHEVIDLYQDALALHPPGHPHRSTSLNNLAGVLSIRFKQLGTIADLHEAIDLLRNALAISTPGHPNHSFSLNNLASAVERRFGQLGGIADLHEVIDLYRNALALRPPGHPHRSLSLNNLANAVLIRFERTGDALYLVEASEFLSDAEISSSVHSPELGRTWTLLARYEICQYLIDSDNNRLRAAFAYFRRTAEYDSFSVKQRLITTLLWVSLAKNHSHESLLHAYSTALELLSRYVVASPSVERQLKLLSMSVDIPPTLALDAAASAIEVGQLNTAVEFLEQGRSLLWTEVRRFRHPIEELRSTNPELASEFETVSRRLEFLALSAENTPVIDPGDDPQVITGTGGRVIPKKTWSSFRQNPEVYDAQLREQRKLSEQWNAVVEKIRIIEGFSHFLKAVPFATLQSAAADGPVVVVNISEYRSDAIIILESLDPILVPLPPRATPKILQCLYTKFRRAHSQFSFNKLLSNELCTCLGILWEIVVGPVVDELRKVGVERGSRIWWCPTSYLCGIPLHAAGPFVPYGKNCSVPDHMWLPDLYVSSYTPTLSVLTSARSTVVSGINSSSLLVVAQTDSLPHVNEEIERIKKFDRKVETMIGEEATREAVLRRLPDHPYVHFACHGSSPDSFRSAFVMWKADRLELFDLINAKLPNAQHAFLSSCHGADTDIQGNPDEMISLAVALQFCGYRGVVGTLWEMKDADGPSIAESFYGYMFDHGVDGKLNVKNSAKALNKTIQEMKMKGFIGEWINFIHIGI